MKSICKYVFALFDKKTYNEAMKGFDAFLDR